MNVWDKVLPHRLFINRALRIESEELHEYIDSYRNKHELEIKRCQADIEKAKKEKNRQFDLIKQAYFDEIAQFDSLMREIETLLLEYADDFLKKQLLFSSREPKRLQLKLLNQYGDFLTEQLNLIGEDINVLGQRQEVLSSHAVVDDVLALLKINGCSFYFEDCDNPKTLLEKVRMELDKRQNLSYQERAALLKLQTVLQERAEYFDVIEYISWLIQQKKQQCTVLFNERANVNKEKKPLKNDLSTIKVEIAMAEQKLLCQAIQVRKIWGEPIADIYCELCDVDETLDELFCTMENLQSEINHMKAIKSNDSDRWERLWKEKNSISDSIGSYKDKKKALLSALHLWFDRRNTILSLYKQNHIFLLTPKGESRYDEVRVLEKRRSDLIDEVESIPKMLLQERTQVVQELRKQEEVLNQQIRLNEVIVCKKQKLFDEEKRRFFNAKGQDTRFFITRIFSELDGVREAKVRLRNAETSLIKARLNLSSVQSKLQQKRDNSNKEISELDKKYKQIEGNLQTKIERVNHTIAYIETKKRG